jgi:hypothetical protein
MGAPFLAPSPWDTGEAGWNGCFVRVPQELGYDILPADIFGYRLVSELKCEEEVYTGYLRLPEVL